MNENVENLILSQLRDLRADIAAMKLQGVQDKAELVERLENIQTAVGGHSVMLNALAGYIGGMERRIERLEEKNDA